MMSRVSGCTRQARSGLQICILNSVVLDRRVLHPVVSRSWVMPLYSFVFFSLWSTQQGKREQKLPCYYFVNLDQGSLTPAACRMENRVSTTVLDIKCLTSVLQMKASALESHFFFWGLSHFVTVSQSINVGVMKQCIKKENSLGLFWFVDREYFLPELRNL